MSRVLTGTQHLPDGNPLSGGKFYFVAKRNETTQIVTGVTSQVTTASNGSYSVELENGFYNVYLEVPPSMAGVQARRWLLGDVIINPGSPISLNLLLATHDTAKDPIQAGLEDLLTQTEAFRDEAEGFSQVSYQQAQDAAQSASLASSKADATSADRTAVAADRQAVSTDRGVVENLAFEVEMDRQEVFDNTAQVAADRQAVASDRTAVASDRASVVQMHDEVETDRGVVEGLASQVTTDRAAVASDRSAVSTDRGVVEGLRQDVADDRSATQSLRNQAEGFRDQSQTNAQSTASDAAATSADRTAVANDKQDVATDRTAVQGLRNETQTFRNQAEQHKLDAQEAAVSASGALRPVGGWDASQGTNPPTPTDGTNPWYRITVSGTIPAIGPVTNGDNIYWSEALQDWFHIDNTEKFTSINGYTSGAVVLSTDDVDEGGRQYHTQARVRSTTLSGLSTGSSAQPTSSDSVLSSLGKLIAKVWSLAISDISGLGTVLNNKQDTESGKGLSTNDYTTAEKNKLSGIQAGAQVNQAFGTTAGTTTEGNDSRLSDSREWTATLVSQAEAEAGSATTSRKWTAQRVRQAILGWWNNSADKTKLDGIQAGAEANPSTTASRTNSSTTVVLQAKAMNDHRTSGDHDSRYASISHAHPADQVEGFQVVDCREIPGSGGASSYIPNPSGVENKAATSLFSMGFAGSSWRSALLVKGWTRDYVAWALSGPAGTGTDDNYYLRSGVGDSWGPDRRIWHSGDFSSGQVSNWDTAYLERGSQIAGTGITWSGGNLNVQYGSSGGTACQGNDGRLSNSREWTAATVSQGEAEAGTSGTRRAWTAQRVRQAVEAALPSSFVSNDTYSVSMQSSGPVSFAFNPACQVTAFPTPDPGVQVNVTWVFSLSGSMSAQTNLGTLPSGTRPNRAVAVGSQLVNAPTSSSAGPILRINENGTVDVLPGPSSTNGLYHANVTYFTNMAT